MVAGAEVSHSFWLNEIEIASGSNTSHHEQTIQAQRTVIVL